MSTIAESINYFVWDEAYETGKDAIDEQHRSIVELINVLHYACESGSPPESVAKLLSDLTGLAEFHFFTEERELLASGSLMYDRHRHEHEQILLHLQTACLSELLTIERRSKVCTLLRTAFARHMYNTDRKDLG